MITITAQVEVLCRTTAELDAARARVAELNLVDLPVVDEAARRITFNLVQIVDAL